MSIMNNIVVFYQLNTIIKDILEHHIVVQAHFRLNFKKGNKKIIEKINPPPPATFTNKAPQSNFLSIVIFNFDNVLFFGIFCCFIGICLLHWVSATKEFLVCHKKGKQTPFWWPTSDSFVALTQCDELNLWKWQKMPKK